MSEDTAKGVAKKKTKKKGTRRGYKFSTLDIETGKKGNVLQIRIYNKKYQFSSFDTWLEFYYFLEKNNDKSEYQNFIAHNGGKFDYISMLYELLPYTLKSDVIMSNSLIICCTINDFKKSVTFQDSMQVMGRSLKVLCKTFKIKVPKQDIDIENIEWIFNHDRNQFDFYLDCDCTSLYEICTSFMELMGIKKFPFTIASFAMNQFLTKFQDKSLECHHINTQEAEQKEHLNHEFYSQSYGGGRVEVFRKGEHPLIYCYDVNSLYPSMMKFYYFPLPPRIVTGKYSDDEMGIFPVSFIQHNRKLPPFFWNKSDNGMEFIYEGKGVYTSVEIKEAKKYGIYMDIGPGIRFLKKGKIFARYVDHFYTLRMKNKDNALNLTCKLALNSLYGKFAEKGEGVAFRQLTDEQRNEVIKEGTGISMYSEKFNLYQVDTNRKIKHAHKYLSAFVTAYARCYMFKYLAEYADHIVYMDTDSIHMPVKMKPEYIGDELGQFKLEYEGKAVYNGRKQYMIDKKVRFKGIRTTGSLFHEDIDENDFKDMLENKPVQKSYDSFPAFKSVIKKGGACKLTRNTKDIKSAKFMSNFGG